MESEERKEAVISENALDELKKRKEDIIKSLKQKKQWLIYVAMLVIAWFGYYIRTRNVSLLQHKWLPDVDSYAFLRYAEYIVAHGKMMVFDNLRYYPFGFYPQNEFGILSYVIAYLYKILHFFNPSTTVVDAAILYPPIALFVSVIFFFLFVKKLFNYKVAIISSAFLVVIPAFLYRTMAGVADKEALAIALLFGVLYFFTSAIKDEKGWHWKSIIAGILTGLTGAVWGGVQFIFVTMGLFATLALFLGLFNKKQIYSYSVWAIIAMIVLYALYPSRFNLNSYLTSLTTQIMLFGLMIAIIIYIFEYTSAHKFKAKIEEKVPLGLFSICVTFALGLIGIIILSGFDSVTGILSNLYEHMAKPFATSRWQMTVAENQQPFFTDIIRQFSWKFMLIAWAGAMVLFYSAVNKLGKKQAINLTAIFTVFLLAFNMSRYASSSTFNGENAISLMAYFGSLIIMFGIIIYGTAKAFFHNKQLFAKLKELPLEPIFALSFFIIMIIAARSAIRLLFVFAPATAILVGYIAVESFAKAKHLKKDAYKIIAYLLIIFVIGSVFWGFSKSTLAQAQYVGPSFNLQWQNAMQWAKENTPEDAVFAHWWDYGYWVQWGANRATISDGGNAYDGINHFVGRHVLTAQNETEALEFLKSRNATHLLIIKEEIGKYPAFSSIGADANYDRYSWINTFQIVPEQTRETRNETVYLYAGGTPMDDDFIYKGKLYPAGSAGIGAFLLPIQDVKVNNGNETVNMQKIGQPKAIMVYNGMQVEVPMRCAYINNQEILFEGEALEGCIRVMPVFEADGRTVNPIGSLLYLSPEVYRGLFAQIFLLNKETEHIKLAYSDEDKGMPLALYQGQQIGPLKIWKITYPDNLEVPKEYYINQLPDPKVNEIRR